MHVHIASIHGLPCKDERTWNFLAFIRLEHTTNRLSTIMNGGVVFLLDLLHPSMLFIKKWLNQCYINIWK